MNLLEAMLLLNSEITTDTWLFLTVSLVGNKQSLSPSWIVNDSRARDTTPPVGIGRAPGCMVTRIANYQRMSHAFFPRPLLWSLNLAELFCATPCCRTAINARSLIFVQNRRTSSACTTSAIYQICIRIPKSHRGCRRGKALEQVDDEHESTCHSQSASKTDKSDISAFRKRHANFVVNETKNVRSMITISKPLTKPRIYLSSSIIRVLFRNPRIEYSKVQE